MYNDAFRPNSNRTVSRPVKVPYHVCTLPWVVRLLTTNTKTNTNTNTNTNKNTNTKVGRKQIFTQPTVHRVTILAPNQFYMYNATQHKQIYATKHAQPEHTHMTNGIIFTKFENWQFRVDWVNVHFLGIYNHFLD